MKNNYYYKKKNQLIDEAIEWQTQTAPTCYDMGEILDAMDYFRTEGKKWGLIREFRENGII